MHSYGDSIVLSPSDLVASTACSHLITLSRKHALGQLVAPPGRDAQAEAIAQRGDAHERRYLEMVRAKGGTLAEIPPAGAQPGGLEEAHAATLHAMRSGADVIYQATFFDGRWRGHADFLERVDRPSDLGAWSYEAVDTKLARSVKPGAVLQLTFYADRVGQLQGHLPARIHVELGDGRRQSFRSADYHAYTRHLMGSLEATVSGPERPTYPDPVAHCSVCRWGDTCDARRRDDDHLSLVAGMRRDQVEKLVAHGIPTLAALATARPNEREVGIGAATLARLTAQAALQAKQRATGIVSWELIPPETGRGLALLPEPDSGDVFFDMEGDPLVSDGGLEYLFGVVTVERGAPTYLAFWAHDKEQEKRAFEALVDWLTERRRRHPSMRVYHYATYERTALCRLAMRHGTREDELDDLLRHEVLMDLYPVVRQGVRVSQEGYSLKKLEPLYMAAREASVKDAGSSIVEYERYLALSDRGDAAAEATAILESIRLYNEEDCRSTWLLREWLEQRRAQLAEKHSLSRPVPKEDGRTEERREKSEERAALVEALSGSVPVDRAARSDAEQARWILGHLLEWHAREAKPDWWAYYGRLKMTEEELLLDSEALGGLEYDGVAGKEKRSILHRYRFDATQEHKVMGGKDYLDPAIGKSWHVFEIDRAKGIVVLKVGPSQAEARCRALVPQGPLDAKAQTAALRAVAEAVVSGTPGSFRAALDLLRRGPPRLCGPRAGVVAAENATVEEQRRIPLLLDESYLAVQGPPGAGKTYVGARMIVSLIAAGRRVAVTANSHRVISNLLREVVAVARAERVVMRVVQKGEADSEEDIEGVNRVQDNKTVERLVADGEVELLAGTAWLVCREALRGAFDTVFVDEAGQMSLANAVAVSTCAKNLVLLGDPCQLAQPSKGTHPEGVGVSALAHVLGDAATLPPDRGLFLATTRRMHPSVCEFVSHVIYEDRLHAHADCAKQAVVHSSNDALTGSGLRWLSVPHSGRSTHAPEEVEAVRRLFGILVGRTWTTQSGGARLVRVEDVLVVSPFNVQVEELIVALPAGARAGTVDKFQGQEAPVVVYSMTCSTAEDAPRGMEFLYGLERLNVAISRAQGMAILVCAPGLLAPPCRTVEQLKMANAVCESVRRAGLVTH